MWHIEDKTHATHFCRYQGNTYFLTAEGEITLTGNILDAPEGCTDEEDFTWFAETGDFTEKGSSQSTSYDGVKKSIAKLWVRIEVAAGAEAKVLMQFDSDGKWVQAGQTLKPERKRSLLPAHRAAARRPLPHPHRGQGRVPRLFDEPRVLRGQRAQEHARTTVKIQAERRRKWRIHTMTFKRRRAAAM